MLILSLAVAFFVGLFIATIATPRQVEYVETISVKVQRNEVYDSIRRQADLMKWSAWPSETGSTCSLKGEDGKLGAQTVFFDKKGQKFGYQEVTDLVENVRVSFKLESKGPPHVPVLHFYLSDLGLNKTHITLHFINDIIPPFHIALRLFGIVKWTRDMHKKDLEGLKRFLERSEDFQGNPI